MKLHRYVDHQRLHIVTKDVISLSISVLLLFRHYISHKITLVPPAVAGYYAVLVVLLFRNTVKSVKHLIPEQVPQEVRPDDLGTNSVQRLSADHKIISLAGKFSISSMYLFKLSQAFLFCLSSDLIQILRFLKSGGIK